MKRLAFKFFLGYLCCLFHPDIQTILVYVRNPLAGLQMLTIPHGPMALRVARLLTWLRISKQL